jgi:ribosome assembly protein YihI (activator of Der GTPase)
MTNEELQKKLNFLKNKLSEANKVNNVELIDECVDKLNSLWDEAGLEMLKNKSEDENTSTFERK